MVQDLLRHDRLGPATTEQGAEGPRDQGEVGSATPAPAATDSAQCRAGFRERVQRKQVSLQGFFFRTLMRHGMCLNLQDI